MRLVIRGTWDRLRSTTSFSVSGIVHGAILAWVAFGTAAAPPEPRQSLYDMEIRANEHRIVWYSLRNRLPDVSPKEPRDPRPPRARFKFSQTLVTGQKEMDRPPQMIWQPAPEVSQPKPQPLPNLVAVAPSRPVREFSRPAEKAAAVLTAPALPDAPEIARAVPDRNAAPLAGDLAAPVRKFTAPQEARPVAAAPVLPDAPRIAAAPERGDLSLPTAMPAGPVRNFTRPQQAAKPVETASVPAAPGVAGPQIPVEASLAIAGLNPAATPDLPQPPGSREAGFSAGPVLRTEGGTGMPTNSTLEVPGLLARGGETTGKPTLVGRVLPFTRENLANAPHLPPAAPAATAPEPGSGESPEDVLRGRRIYTVAFQMPNVTSYSGSWTVWFAEHEEAAQRELLRPPVPLRKVDPKYIASAAAEHVEGRVRLFGVIRKDGHVEHIVVLKGLDARLDRSSAEALGLWLFEPAQRAGRPVDVDAVFEIPFRLAPKPSK